MSESWFCSEGKHACWISLPQAPLPECGHWTGLTLQKEVCGSGVQGYETQVLIWVGRRLRTSTSLAQPRPPARGPGLAA